MIFALQNLIQFRIKVIIKISSIKHHVDRSNVSC